MVVFARRRGLALGLVAVALVLALAPAAAAAAPGGGASASPGAVPSLVQSFGDLIERLFDVARVFPGALGSPPALPVEKDASVADPFGNKARQVTMDGRETGSESAMGPRVSN